MAEALYNLVITKYTAGKPADNLVHQALGLLDKAGDSYVEYKLSESLLFEQHQSAILENISLAEGEKYQKRLQALHIETELMPALQVLSPEAGRTNVAQTYTCPVCEHTQAKQNGDNVCEKCGVSGEQFQAKLDRQLKRKEIYEFEKRKLEQERGESLQQAKERARHEEIEALRAEARRRLGVKKKKRNLAMVMAIAVVIAVGGGAFLVMDRWHEQSPAEQMADADGAANSVDTVDGVANSGAANMIIAQGTPDQTLDLVTGQQTAQKLIDAVTGEVIEGVQGNEAAPGMLSEHSAVTAGTEIAMNQAPRSLQPLPQVATAELEKLTNNMQAVIEQKFAYVGGADYAKHLSQLEQLLALDKPELVFVFIETVRDPYTAALLTLHLAHAEHRNKREQYNEKLLFNMKSLAAQGVPENQQPFMTAALSQVYRLTGDETAATSLLGKVVEEVDQYAETPAERVSLITQLITMHQQFAQYTGAETLTQDLETMATVLPAEQPGSQFTIANIYAHLAAIALQNADMADAGNWIKRIPAPNARQHLLIFLETAQARLVTKD